MPVQLKVVENCGLALSALSAVLYLALPPPSAARSPYNRYAVGLAFVLLRSLLPSCAASLYTERYPHDKALAIVTCCQHTAHLQHLDKTKTSAVASSGAKRGAHVSDPRARAVNSAMPILAGVGMQLRTLARLKQRTLINAAEIFAGFMLVYYMIASKRCGRRGPRGRRLINIVTACPATRPELAGSLALHVGHC